MARVPYLSDASIDYSLSREIARGIAVFLFVCWFPPNFVVEVISSLINLSKYIMLEINFCFPSYLFMLVVDKSLGTP